SRTRREPLSQRFSAQRGQGGHPHPKRTQRTSDQAGVTRLRSRPRGALGDGLGLVAFGRQPPQVAQAVVVAALVVVAFAADSVAACDVGSGAGPVEVHPFAPPAGALLGGLAPRWPVAGEALCPGTARPPTHRSHLLGSGNRAATRSCTTRKEASVVESQGPEGSGVSARYTLPSGSRGPASSPAAIAALPYRVRHCGGLAGWTLAARVSTSAMR